MLIFVLLSSSPSILRPPSLLISFLLRAAPLLTTPSSFPSFSSSFLFFFLHFSPSAAATLTVTFLIFSHFALLSCFYLLFFPHLRSSQPPLSSKPLFTFHLYFHPGSFHLFFFSLCPAALVTAPFSSHHFTPLLIFFNF